MNILKAFEQAHAVVMKSSRVLIACPHPVDMDAIASSTLIDEYLKQYRKPHDIYCRDQFPSADTEPLMRFLPPLSVHTKFPDALPDCVITADYGSFGTVGLHSDMWFPKESALIGFDHHAHPATDFPKHGMQITDPNAAATTALLFRFLDHLGVPLNNTIATAVALGIYTDTGRLTRPPEKIHLDTLMILARCVSSGIPWVEMQKAARPIMTLDRLRIWEQAIKEVHYDPHSRVICLMVDLEKLQYRWKGTAKDILTLFGQHIETLRDVSVAVLILQEDRYGWKIMLRTQHPEKISVHEIAEALNTFGGGGGHADRAVARMSTAEDGEPLAVLAKIKFEVLKRLNKK